MTTWGLSDYNYMKRQMIVLALALMSRTGVPEWETDTGYTLDGMGEGCGVGLRRATLLPSSLPG
jgi:hypothetical protein